MCCVDLGEVARLQRAWSALMPRVTPFYAVKCNNDTAILATLAALGAGFDCASDAEVIISPNSFFQLLFTARLRDVAWFWLGRHCLALLLGSALPERQEPTCSKVGRFDVVLCYLTQNEGQDWASLP